ncbi:c6 finger domain [Fusarium longipes]|uniref:C6 finger domain n=1 Tax=Fusarium longipes TaxID=694270 RepID=A0A395SYI4_9HYPO|nr:c6 finger domain [Fusarium longipes]
MNLQEIACATARQGLVCIAEQQGTRPNWETWVLAEAKRRTLYTMYFLDNVLSAKDGLPTFIAHELKGLYAPSSKDLWQSGRAEWEQAYNLHLVEWVDGTFQLDELWPMPEEMGGDEIEHRQRRTDRWLEAVDEYGTMLYAVTSCTYGGTGTSEELAAGSLRDEII